jgi:DNA-binding beta-propeller fold protein YncE
MKTILGIILMLSNINLIAQREVIVTGLNKPTGLIFNGNDLYIAESKGNKISKINITDTNISIKNVITGLNNPVRLALNGNDLYISEFEGNKISKIDISNENPTIVDVVTELQGPNGLAINGDYLYIAQTNANKISRINITDENSVIEDIVSGNHTFHPFNQKLDKPYDLLFNDDKLYVSNFGENKAITIVSIIDPIGTIIGGAGNFNFPIAFAINDDNLYCSAFNPEAIHTISISSSDVTNSLESDFITGMIIKDNSLYVSGGSRFTSNTTTIFKYDLSTLSLNNNFTEEIIKISPNPSNNFIHITGLTRNENYKIFDILGKEFINGRINNHEKIDIQNLAKGLYFLKFENGNYFRFIKK